MMMMQPTLYFTRTFNNTLLWDVLLTHGLYDVVLTDRDTVGYLWIFI